MSSELIKHITDASFDADVLKSDTPVLVDYWAEWCGPCKSIAPILDEVAKEYEGRLKIAKINVDENQQTPAKFGIRGIPTLLFIPVNGAPMMHTGAPPRKALQQIIEKKLIQREVHD